MTEQNFDTLKKSTSIGHGVLVKKIGLNAYVYYQYCGMGENYMLKYRMALDNILITDLSMLSWDYYTQPTKTFFVTDTRLLIPARVQFNSLPYEPEPIAEKDVYKVVPYNERSIAIFGDTWALKEKISSLRPLFSRFLTNPETNKKEKGYILPITKQTALMAMLAV